MSRFATPLKCEPTGAKLDWRPIFKLIEPLVYELAPGCVITIPAGFETDFASVPRNPWIGPGGPLAEAATLHDFCYRRDTFPGRRLADALFDQAMRDTGVPDAERELCWRAVSLFGGSSFQRLPVDHRFPVAA